MAESFSINIFVPSGNPEGLRILEIANWTGIGFVFPRDEWKKIRKRSEMSHSAVYLLVGTAENDESDDIPTIYIGQSDDLVKRFRNHDKETFWNIALVFVCSKNSWNRGHISWLEYALIKRAKEIKQCYLKNANSPKEPLLSESENADMQNFFKRIIQILPLLGVTAFKKVKRIYPKNGSNTKEKKKLSNNTIVVPAKEVGFKTEFLKNDRFFPIRISGGMLDKLQFIAAYQSHPVSAITHYAPIDRIESYGQNGRYIVYFSKRAKKIKPIAWNNSPTGTLRSPRYTTLDKLKEAKTFEEVFE